MEKKSGHDEIKLEKREVSQQFVAALRAIRHSERGAKALEGRARAWAEGL